MSKESNTGGITILKLKLYYRAIAIKTVLYRHKNRYEDQCNKTEDLAINPGSLVHLNFDKSIESMQWRKDSIFNKCCWENWVSACRKLKLYSHLSPCYKYQLKVD
jgi:hypothetical protein